MNTSSKCNACGAPLSAALNDRYFTCEYCRSNLAIDYASGNNSTEARESIDQPGGQMGSNNELPLIRQEIEMLDSQWQSRNEQYFARKVDLEWSLSGSRTRQFGYIATFSMLSLAIYVLLLSSTTEGAGVVLGVLIAIALLVGSAVMAWRTFTIARRHRQLRKVKKDLDKQHVDAEQDYQRERSEKLRRLEAL